MWPFDLRHQKHLVDGWSCFDYDLRIPSHGWWRTTPVATKAWHYGAGGADTYARPAPSTGEDEGSRVSLHQVRPSSRHELARVELSFPFSLLLWLYLARTCLSGPLHVSLSLFRPLGGFPLCFGTLA